MSDRQLTHLMEHLVDRYDFISLLGEGGAGTVFEVENRALHRREALKILREPGMEGEGSARFVHEARIAASLDHPSIVRIHEFGRDAGVLWYSMQLVDGPTLGRILDGGRRLDGPGAVQVAVPVLDALVFSHGHGVIHRDIKPANILFNKEGHPFLTDFGIAKAVENPLDTRTGLMLGTPAYVAPEQALGKTVDARADLYALGASLYRAVTGRLPFDAGSVLQTLLLRLQDEAPPLERLRPDIHPALAGVIMRSLARDREDRWANASEMRSALLGACEAMGGPEFVPWDRPLEVAREFPQVRTPLPVSEAEGNPARGVLETTADLPRPLRRWGRIAVLGAGVMVLAVGAMVRFSRQRTSREPASANSPIPAARPTRSPAPLPAPLAASGVKAPVPPAPEGPRRAVVYPQLLGDGASPVPSPGCGGLSVSVSLVVGEDGNVRSCKVLSQVKPECAEAARAVALNYHFKPALDAQGRPVQAILAAAVEFPESK